MSPSILRGDISDFGEGEGYGYGDGYGDGYGEGCGFGDGYGEGGYGGYGDDVVAS